MAHAKPVAWFLQAKGDIREITVIVDSDWASNPLDRRSIAADLVCLGGAPVAHWSRTQASTALSSAEAELVAVCEGMCEGLGVLNILKRLSSDFEGAKILIFADSTAARAACLRIGPDSRLSHVDVKC